MVDFPWLLALLAMDDHLTITTHGTVGWQHNLFLLFMVLARKFQAMFLKIKNGCCKFHWSKMIIIAIYIIYLEYSTFFDLKQEMYWKFLIINLSKHDEKSWKFNSSAEKVQILVAFQVTRKIHVIHQRGNGLKLQWPIFITNLINRLTINWN